jgi:hypothetical protein
MKREFQIYKEGVTLEKITILSRIGECFNREYKIKKYLYLGYNVFDLNGNKIA